MATQAQIDANRRNARKSTGPRTPEGKDRSSRNRLLHGLTAEKHFLPGEDPAAFETLLARFRDEWRPAGPTEEGLVERMAVAHWRLRRFAPMEAGLFNLSFETDPLPELFRQGRADPLAWAFKVGCTFTDRFLKLARYESHLQREFSRCLRELQKLKAVPRPEALPAPAAQDRPAAPESEIGETKPIPKRVAARPAVPRRLPSRAPQGKNPLEVSGPPPRWTDFAPEVTQRGPKDS